MLIIIGPGEGSQGAWIKQPASPDIKPLYRTGVTGLSRHGIPNLGRDGIIVPRGIPFKQARGFARRLPKIGRLIRAGEAISGLYQNPIVNMPPGVEVLEDCGISPHVGPRKSGESGCVGVAVYSWGQWDDPNHQGWRTDDPNWNYGWFYGQLLPYPADPAEFGQAPQAITVRIPKSSGEPQVIARFATQRQAEPIYNILPDVLPIAQPPPVVVPVPHRFLPQRRPSEGVAQGTQRGYGPQGQPPFPQPPGPPPAGVKEKKAGLRGAGGVIGGIMTGINAVSESVDALEAVWEALPAQYRTKPTARPGRSPGVSPQDMLGDVVEHWEHIDPGAAAYNLAVNAVEDAGWGRVGRGLAAGSGNLPRPAGIGIQAGPGM